MRKYLSFLLFLPLLFGCGNRARTTETANVEPMYERVYMKDAHGAVIRINPDKPVIYMFFTFDKSFEGTEHVLDVLAKHNIQAFFCPTGNTLRDPEFYPLFRRIIADGHSFGGHGNKHILWAPWPPAERVSLVSRDSLMNDLYLNMREFERFGVNVSQIRYFNPPYQWYTAEQVEWVAEFGQTLFNFTPGVRTGADWTTPDMPNYMSSPRIIESLFEFEATHELGLNGAIMLIHPGTDPRRIDKLYHHLDYIIERLKGLGYSFGRL